MFARIGTRPVIVAGALIAPAVIALRAANSRGEPATEPSGTPAAPGQVPRGMAD